MPSITFLTYELSHTSHYCMWLPYDCTCKLILVLWALIWNVQSWFNCLYFQDYFYFWPTAFGEEKPVISFYRGSRIRILTDNLSRHLIRVSVSCDLSPSNSFHFNFNCQQNLYLLNWYMNGLSQLWHHYFLQIFSPRILCLRLALRLFSCSFFELMHQPFLFRHVCPSVSSWWPLQLC